MREQVEKVKHKFLRSEPAIHPIQARVFPAPAAVFLLVKAPRSIQKLQACWKGQLNDSLNQNEAEFDRQTQANVVATIEWIRQARG